MDLQKDPATGLHYLYRRFYDPDLGRFLFQDVILGHVTVPTSLARYTYRSTIAPGRPKPRA